jgi:hypothetical protein
MGPMTSAIVKAPDMNDTILDLDRNFFSVKRNWKAEPLQAAIVLSGDGKISKTPVDRAIMLPRWMLPKYQVVPNVAARMR